MRDNWSANLRVTPNLRNSGIRSKGDHFDNSVYHFGGSNDQDEHLNKRRGRLKKENIIEGGGVPMGKIDVDR